MKSRDLACSRCCGKGEIEQYMPHQSQPEHVTCPQCEGRRVIAVMVPDEEEASAKTRESER